jgi:FKBP-type peptidyl-prolyl cis-trans isomerase FkpA
MKRNIYFLAMIAALALITSCNTDYKKTKSGLVYKIFHQGKSSDPLAKNNDVLKYNIIEKLNDSLFATSYGKMPGYSQLSTMNIPNYSPIEIFPFLRKGDSAVVVLSMDTLMKLGVAQQQFPMAKKGDKLTLTYKILNIFHEDSTARADMNLESEKDKPRQQKEMEEQMAKQEKAVKEQREKDETEWKKSGEIDKEIKAMEKYLAAKKITALKTGKGTFVVIKDPGNGPAAQPGKWVTVKYNGKRLENDSTFQANTYTFQLGKGVAIQGWDEGIQLFKKGGKGTLYIPGFLAFGKNPPPGSPFKEFDPVIFDIEIIDVKDTQ